ncbi:MAG: glycosyltransferase [Syntrophomonas sp.]
MKLLVIARDWNHFASRQLTHNLLLELAKITELFVWHERGDDISQILNQLDLQPDFVLVLEYYETNASRVSGLSRLTIPYAISLMDLHWDVEFRKELIERESISYIFTPCRDAFNKWYPEFKDRMLWLPHHVNTDIFKDYGLPKDIDYLLMGSISASVYPLRDRILYEMRDSPGFVYHEHPGYRYIADDENAFIGEKYAREINRAKIFFTCGGANNYPVAKYYEALACNTLLLAPTFSELEDLGFIPGTHFVAIDINDYREKAEYYLGHEQERLQIALQGYKMVRDRHSTTRRAAELLTAIEGIISLHYGDSDFGGLTNE